MKKLFILSEKIDVRCLIQDEPDKEKGSNFRRFINFYPRTDLDYSLQALLCAGFQRQQLRIFSFYFTAEHFRQCRNVDKNARPGFCPRKQPAGKSILDSIELLGNMSFFKFVDVVVGIQSASDSFAKSSGKICQKR
jgi:hypothetical protein